MPCQATSRSLFTRRHLGTDEGFAGAPQTSASGERHLCNSEFHQCNLILTRWHFIWVNVLRQYTKKIKEAATHTVAQVVDAHPSDDFLKRPSKTSKCPEQVLRTRQNRCLQGLCECSGAGIYHFVVVERQLGEGDVCLVIFHSTNARPQAAACVPSHAHHCTSVVDFLYAWKCV